MKIPILALAGIALLLIGFSPEILATVHIDATPPDITWCKPWPVEETALCPLVPDANGNFEIYVDIEPLPDDVDKVVCVITFPDGTTTDTVELTYQHLNFQKDYHYLYPFSNFTQTGNYYFEFTATDVNGNSDSMTGLGGLGAPEGDFYMKDGNDLEYVLVTKDASITFNHRTVYFEFRATKNAIDISNVWLSIEGRTGALELTKGTDGVTWNGSSWTFPADGTYQVKGKYRSVYGELFYGLSILVGSNEEPTSPSEWSTYDWLKIPGVVLIVVGFIVKK